MLKKTKSSRHLLIIISAIATLIIMILIYIWYYLSIQTHALNGTITQIKYNCGPNKILTADNKVITSTDNTLCDVGDSIVVGGKNIYTSSGNVAEDKRFSVDISSFEPGDRVKVIYVDHGSFSLNCSKCSITKE